MTLADPALSYPATQPKTASPSTRVFAYHRPVFGVVAALFSGGRSDLLEPSGAHHPGWLTHCLGGSRTIMVRQGPELTGLFATEVERWRWGVPLPVVTSPASDLLFDGTPLIARQGAGETIRAFIAAKQGGPVLLRAIPAEGAFLKLLREVALDLDAPVAVTRRWERAALKPRGRYEHWFETNFERKRKKEYRRLRTRLAEQGDLESAEWNESEPVQHWIDDLWALEAKGWKGREGTAVAADPERQAGLTRALKALAREGALRFWKLSFNGEAIAMMFAIVSGRKAWLGKIAYDERFAKSSPGVLLILQATEALFAQGRIALVDSCAIPGHPMIDNIWRERIQLCDVLIGRPGLARPLFVLMIAAEKARLRLRGKLKSTFYRMTGRRMS